MLMHPLEPFFVQGKPKTGHYCATSDGIFTYGAACLTVAVVANHIRRILTPWLGQFAWHTPFAIMKLARTSPHGLIMTSLESIESSRADLVRWVLLEVAIYHAAGCSIQNKTSARAAHNSGVGGALLRRDVLGCCTYLRREQAPHDQQRTASRPECFAQPDTSLSRQLRLARLSGSSLALCRGYAERQSDEVAVAKDSILDCAAWAYVRLGGHDGHFVRAATFREIFFAARDERHASYVWLDDSWDGDPDGTSWMGSGEPT
ncbi:hypothetical protein HIM_03449 [Hirsutella minnesotensis 3608]|uniref:Uncharacterized protein n=1 Tax=Hirsutella minnesotensis 3608 TaxID=1043627 RepID=A0A0F7ZVS6_9HYPO|nr:hypothetical protein HIM_03449 [Hirsutella minnesotensis 3608]